MSVLYSSVRQDEWVGAGRWKAPEEQMKTDVYEWPAKPGMNDDDLALFARRRGAGLRQQMLRREVVSRGVGLGARRVMGRPVVYYEE